MTNDHYKSLISTHHIINDVNVCSFSTYKVLLVIEAMESGLNPEPPSQVTLRQLVLRSSGTCANKDFFHYKVYT